MKVALIAVALLSPTLAHAENTNGSVMFSGPKGAAVELDGKAKGVLPISPLKIPAGNYELKATLKRKVLTTRLLVGRRGEHRVLIDFDKAKIEEDPCSIPFGPESTWDFAELQKNLCNLCGKGRGEEAASMFCELDYPFSDVPDCKAWDHMRNGIYARFGYPFKKKKWRELFQKYAWYRPDPKFDFAKLPAAAQRNAQLFKKYKLAKNMCANYEEKMP